MGHTVGHKLELFNIFNAKVTLHWRCTGGAAGAAASIAKVMPIFIDVAVGANRFFHNPLGLAEPQIASPNRLVFVPCWSYIRRISPDLNGQQKSKHRTSDGIGKAHIPAQ